MIEKLKWSRITLPGKPEGHNHSFIRDGEEKRTVEVFVDTAGGKGAPTATINAGLKDLLGTHQNSVSFNGFSLTVHDLLTFDVRSLEVIRLRIRKLPPL